jgi:hypothetical protein
MKFRLLFSLFLSASVLYGGQQRGYSVDLEIENPQMAVSIGSAAAKVINLTGEVTGRIGVKIYDEKEKRCILKGVNHINEKELEIVFTPSVGRAYRLLVDFNSQDGQKYTVYEKGRMLIDDFLPVNSVKSGEWRWEDVPSFSGRFSHTGREGLSMHRVSFPSTVPIKAGDKIVLYVYIPSESPPEEVMVEVETERRRRYFFSFGRDRIEYITGKVAMGGLPERDRWVKLEIPLTAVSEKSIKALGFYNSSGRVWWDRVSLNDVPAGCNIKSVREKDGSATAYFDYVLNRPLKAGDETFEIVQVEALDSLKPERYLWENGGKTFSERRVEILFRKGCDRKVILNTESQGSKNSVEYTIPEQKGEPEEVSITAKILPYVPFVSSGTQLYLPVSVTSMNDETISAEIRSNDFSERITLDPGQRVQRHVAFKGSPTTGPPVELSLSIHNIRIWNSFAAVRGPEYADILLEGPFIKDEKGNYLMIGIPEYAVNKKRLPKGKRLAITLAGSYPEQLKKIMGAGLKRYGISAEIDEIKEPFYNYNHRLFSEYLHLSERIKRGVGGDIMVIFPYTESMIMKSPTALWEKSVDAVTYLASQKFSALIFVSPFPAPPSERFYPYRKVMKNLASQKGIFFLDLYSLYTAVSGGERFFLVSEGIYQNLPDEKGTVLLAGWLLEAVLNMSR